MPIPRQQGALVMSVSLRRWLVYWGVWTILGIYMATMDAVRFPAMPFFTTLVPMNLAQNLVFGCAGLGVLALARRWPLERFAWAEWRNWVIHLVGSIMLAIAALWVIYRIAGVFQSAYPSPHPPVAGTAESDHGFMHFVSEY